MGIKKETPTKLKITGDTYIVLPSKTLSLLKNTNAIAILAYLLDKPADWVVRKTDICNRFDLSRRKYTDAMKELISTGLCTREFVQGKDGRLSGTILHVSGCPIVSSSVSTEDTKTGSVGDPPRVPVTDTSVSSTPREMVPLHITESLHTKEVSLNKTQELIPKGNSCEEVEGFERIWSIYPRKVGKAQAERTFKKLKPNYKILQAIEGNVWERLKAGDWTLDKKAFIPHLSTYLNGRRWEDEIIPQPEFNAPTDYDKLRREFQEI